MSLFPTQLRAQGVCATAIPIPATSPCLVNQLTSDSAWYKFTASSTTMYITLVSTNDTANYSHIHLLKLLSGSCSTLSVITMAEGDSVIGLTGTGLTVGNTYYLLAFTHVDPACPLCQKSQAKFNLCTSYTSVPCVAQLQCSLVQNGGFTDNTTGSPIPANVQNPFLGSVCFWSIMFATPALMQTGAISTSQSVWMWAQSSSVTADGEGIMTSVNVQSGKKYELVYFSRRVPVPGSTTVVDNCHVLLAQSQNSGFPRPGLATAPIPVNSQEIDHQLNITSTAWIRHVACFTANNNYDQLGIYPSTDLNHTQINIKSWLGIDDVTLYRVADAGHDTIVGCSTGVQIGSCTIPGATYSWLPATGLSNPSISNPVAFPSSTTTYTVTVTTADGCTATDDVTVTRAGNPAPGISNSGANSCSAGTYCPSLVTSGSSYSWQVTNPSNAPIAFTSSGNCITVNWPVASGGAGGNVILTEINSLGCVGSTTLTITGTPTPTIHIVPPQNTAATTCADSLLFSETASGFFASFLWTTNATGYSGQTTAALHTHWNGQTSNGYVTVTGTTTLGCKAKDSLMIPSCCMYYTPENILMPNIVNDSSSHLSVSHPGLFTLISSTYTATDKQFSINGLFIVNENTSFLGCDVKLGPNAKIILRPGKTLLLNKTATNYTRLHACSDLWDGIYVDGTNSLTTLKVVGGTSIEDAKNAIVSVKGGYFVLDGTSGGQVKLNKNNIGVLIKTYSGTHPGIIRNTIISCDAPGQAGATPVTYAGANCRAPVNGKAFAAVYIDSCTNVTVGDSAVAAYRNLMERQKFGVYSKNSNVKVWNNDFKYYTLAPGPYKNNPLEGVAVYATGNSTLTRTLTVGRAGNYKAHNLARKCSYGVMAENYMNLSCEYNRLDSISAMGVFALNDLNRNILVNKDSITEFTGTGVNCTNIKQSTVTITGNLLNETTTNTPSSFGYTGIYISNALNFTTCSVKIQSNTIKRIRNGIWVMNVTRAQVMDNTITFYPNQVTSSAFPGIGIKMEAAHSALVRNNTVSNNITGNPAASSYDRVLGISVTSCTNDTITQNVLTKCGSGLFMKGTNWPVLIGCNKFVTCYYGANFGYANSIQTSVYIPSELRWGNPASGTPTPTGNTWTGTVSGADMKGKIYPPITWWCNASNIPNTASMLVGSLSGISNTPITIGASDQCAALLNPVTTGSPAELRDALLSGICKTRRTYDTLSAQYHYIDSVYAFRTLKDNPSWLSLGTGDDSYYASWYSTVSGTNVGKLALVEDDIKAKNTSAALSVLNALTPNGTPESNRMAVLNVYLHTWATDSMNLDSLQTLTLSAIAEQAPVTGGTAVYDARAMLFLEIHDSSALRLAPVQYPESSAGTFAHVYPNPTTGKMTLNYTLPQGQSGVLQLYDLAGRAVRSYPLSGETSEQQFDAGDVPAGLYFYTVWVNGAALWSEKLILIKQE